MTVKLKAEHIPLVKQIATLARERDKANDEAKTLIYTLARESDPMPEKRFWELVKGLRKLLEQSNWASETSIHNFYCEFFTNELTEMVRFYKTYDEKVCQLHRSEELFDNIQVCSDDTFGDILDSFPLLGQVRFNRAVTKGNPYKTMEELESKDSKAINQGENYICMYLLERITELANFMDEGIEQYM